MRFRAHNCACKLLHFGESACTAGIACIWLRTPRPIKTVLAVAVSGQDPGRQTLPLTLRRLPGVIWNAGYTPHRGFSFVFALEWFCCCCSHNNALDQAHACGGSNCKPRGIPTLATRAQRKWKGRSAAEVCTSEARKIGEWLAGASGQSPLGRVFAVAVRQGQELRTGDRSARGVAQDAPFLIAARLERSKRNKDREGSGCICIARLAER